ncbi:hypothetical protein [Croceicoccus sp. Ery15]
MGEFLQSKETGHEQLWVRINPVDDLAVVMPGSFMLPKSRDRHDMELLDH